MRTQGLNSRVSWLFSVVALMIAFQSCSDKENIASPRAISKSNTEVPPTTPPPCKSACLVAGQHTNVGSVDVDVLANKDVRVTYKVTAPGIYLLEVHMDVFALNNVAGFKAAGKANNGGAIPGKFTYKQSFNKSAQQREFSFTIPAGQLSEDCFSIAAHAALSNGETAWGSMCSESNKGVSMDKTATFGGKNWSGYFNFCKSECRQQIDFTYAWEDLQNIGNDGDYNDLVVQSIVTKSTSELTINFLAVARGASLDHAFKFRIPTKGIIMESGKPQIFLGPNAVDVTTNGLFYEVTMYPSTAASLPGLGASGFTNTVQADPCFSFPSQKVTIKTNNEFVYDAAKPYEPFITVKTSTPYDLYIYGVTPDAATWLDGSIPQKQYPNGIIIPKDWAWPVERQIITGPYPAFTSITEGFNSNWAASLADASLTYDKSKCAF
ncbi:LruC domain-containing protein [Hymenobacter sp. HD11105]